MLLAAFVLLTAGILPTSVWRDSIVGSTTWNVWDDGDLRYLRFVFEGFSAIAFLATLLAGWEVVSRRISNPATRKRIHDGTILSLILLTGYFVARLFIVWHDRVRITGPKTPFSNWGEFLGRIWTVPFQPYTDRDYFNSLFLAFAGFTCLLMFVLRHKGMVRTRQFDFPLSLWGLLSFGFLWSSLDELVMIHEFLGPNLPILRSTHFTKYPDDVIMLMYFAGGAIVLFAFRKFFMARRLAFLVFVVGMICQGLSAVNGMGGILLNEESFEMYGGLCYFASMFWYAYNELSDSFQQYSKTQLEKSS